MSKSLKISLFAIALALVAGMIGYWFPVISYVVGFVAGLMLISVLLGGGGAVADAFPPLVALGRWLAVKDEFRWVRRAPLLGLIAGTLVKWGVGRYSSPWWMWWT